MSFTNQKVNFTIVAGSIVKQFEFGFVIAAKKFNENKVFKQSSVIG